jgi:N-acetylmuramate 1-kinase
MQIRINAARTAEPLNKMQRLSRYTLDAAFAANEWSSMPVADASDSRLEMLTRWVVEDLGFSDSLIAPASADASFRRYFRVTRGSDTYIVMDAPPGKEDLAPFLQVGRILNDIGVNVPAVLARDNARGLLLLSDLGTQLYLGALSDEAAADPLYGDALRALREIQTADAALGAQLPRYDHALLTREMELMPEWFLQRHLGLTPSGAQRRMLNQLFELLSNSAAEQPAVIVHRDYHSRNLLVTADRNPGILDFQDAVWGPVTYDVASLLKDCYIAWPAARVREWVLGFRDSLLERGFAAGSAAQFLRWFDLIGLQRHIKVLGIFARLYYRDGKSGYLKDLPRVLDYTRAAAAAYAETAPFAQFLAAEVEARFAEAQAGVAP